MKRIGTGFLLVIVIAGGCAWFDGFLRLVVLRWF